MRYGGLGAILAVALVGCQGSGDTTPQPTSSSTTTASVVEKTSPPTPPPPPAVPAAEARKVVDENPLFDFSFAYPAQVAAIPALKAQFDRDIDASKADIAAATKTEKDMSAKENFPFRPHSRTVDWKVVADLPNWLSLSSELYDFTGGAHGNSGFDSLVWDRSTETARKPLDLFTSNNDLRKAVQAPFCAAIDKERAKRRGAPVDRNADGLFNDCIDPTEQTVILGSTNKGTFDRIGILVGPYNAGPYVEGSYEVTLPVTGQVMAAIKPQYRNAFSVGR